MMTEGMMKRFESLENEIKKLNFTHDQACLMFDTLVTLKGLMKSVIEDDKGEYKTAEDVKHVLRAMYAYIWTTLKNSGI